MLKQNKAAFLFHILVGQPVITRGLFSQGPGVPNMIFHFLEEKKLRNPPSFFFCISPTCSLFNSAFEESSGEDPDPREKEEFGAGVIPMDSE